jgi:uncharacterized membrane protein (UPF0127 family)
VRTITITAIAASAAAGIIAAVLFYPSLYVGSFGSTAGSNNQQNLHANNTTLTNSSSYRQVKITVNGIELIADIAATSDQKSKGLGVKDSLKDNEAMLFPFSEVGEHTFWMKGMKFPIDIIWLDDDKQVVHVEHSLEPCVPNSFCQTYTPREDSLYVLETVAGFAQKYNVTQSTLVQFELDG